MKLENFTFERIKYFDEKENIEKALKIYKNNSDFFSLLAEEGIKNEKITKKTVIKDLELLPDNKDYDDKYYGLILDTNNNVIGLLDLIYSYPNTQTAYIGLFVIDKPFHRQGLGSQLYYELETFLKTEGFSKIRLGVLKTNPKALSFWKSLDFAEIKFYKSFYELEKSI